MSFAAPTFYRQMAALVADYDLSSLRNSVSAGDALPDATRRLWRDATGIEMLGGIGGTEMIHGYVSSAGKEVRPGALGQAVPGQVATGVDQDLNIVPHGTVGTLAV